MRLFTIVVPLALGIAIGWVGGTLHPAPRAWLAWSNLGAIEQLQNDAAEAPSANATSDAEGATALNGTSAADTLEQYRTWIHEARVAHPSRTPFGSNPA
jgi:hypothetical protein